MTWLIFFFGYFAGTLVTLLVIYFGYRIGEMNKLDDDWLDKSVEKEMEQYRALRDDKG
ncbi:hypothetical protein AALF16_26055 [Bacillus cereus]|uniref:hypothetical protein n=1 Tax=Bacillus cereus TaxID=1396 RepID=UPI00356F4759